MKENIAKKYTAMQEDFEKKVNTGKTGNLTLSDLLSYCGDNGIAWNDEYDVTGRIGKSCGGRFNIPLLIHNSRSYGGGAILTGRIGRIDIIDSHYTIYKKDNFTIPDFRITYDENLREYPYTLLFWNKEKGLWEVHASCKEEKQAKRLMDFMTGKRYCK